MYKISAGCCWLYRKANDLNLGWPNLKVVVERALLCNAGCLHAPAARVVWTAQEDKDAYDIEVVFDASAWTGRKG